MKKIFFIVLSVIFALNLHAQNFKARKGLNKVQLPAKFRNMTVPSCRKKEIGFLPQNNLQSRRYFSPVPSVNNENFVGYTFYDLQTNGSTSNRIVYNNDGTISAAWTFSPDAIQTPTTFPNRGVGYNYYDGNNWNPTPNTSIVASRTGFTNVAVTSSGAEITLQHTGTGLSEYHRPVKGTGSWTTSTPFGTGNNDSWPKMIAAGNYVYAIWQGTGSIGTPVAGQDGPIFFSRSTDDGNTWSTPMINPLIDSTQYYGFDADAYSIDADTLGNVVIAYGGNLVDVGVLKSTDFGQTWTKTIVQSFPIPLYDANTMITDINIDGLVDTIYSNAGDVHVMLDHQGMVHLWFGLYRFYNDLSTPGSWNSFPATDGLEYWNEQMLPDGYVEIANAIDWNGNGSLDIPLDATCDLPWGTYAGTLTEMASSGIDENDRIYVSYQTIDELADTTFYFQAHKHVYVMTLPYPYNPNDYTMPYDIVPSIDQGGDGENQEAVFCTMAKKVFANGDAWFLYQRDNAPGHALSSTGTCALTNNLGNVSDIIATSIPSTSLIMNGSSCMATFASSSVALDAYFIDLSHANINTTSYQWNFGDGSGSTLRFPQHTYSVAGWYNVCLSIQDGTCMDSTCRNVFIDSVVNVSPCNANFVVTQTSPYQLTVVNISSGQNLTYSWDFGDNSTSNLIYPSHTYAGNGAYNLCLTVSDTAGCSSMYCDSISVDSLGNIIYRGTTGLSIIVVSPSQLTAGIVNPMKDLNTSIFPNPSHASIQLKSAGLKGTITYRILSMEGTEVGAGTLSNAGESIRIESLMCGMYILDITDGSQNKAYGRFIKY